MKREIKNIKEYILTTMAICGEIKVMGVGQKIPFSETYVLRHFTEMLEEGLIRKYEYDDGKFYRLSRSGIALIEKDMPELMSHLDILIGERGARYKGTKEKRKRRRHSLEIASLGLAEEMCVDFFELSPNEMSFERLVGSPSEKLIAAVDPERKTFLTKRMLYGPGESLETHPRNHMFRTVGVFFSGTGVFPAYYMDAPGEKYNHDVEVGFVNLLTKSLKQNYKEEVERCYGIFYMNKESTMREFVLPEKKGYRFQPGTVYNIFYILPMNKSVGVATSLILTPHWREKVNALLIESSGNMGDGTSSSGLPVYNFLGNNIAYMKKNAPALRNNKSVLIIHDWQEEIARKLFGENHELRVVEEDMLRAILNDIK